MAYRPQLKICGVTNVADARLVGASGADYCGILVDVRFSERSLPLREAREVASESAVPVVALLRDPKREDVEGIVRETAPHAVQLLGGEAPEFIAALRPRLACQIWKTLHLPVAPGQAPAEEYAEAGTDALLIDRSEATAGVLRLGGTGKVVDWERAAALVEQIGLPVFLAGGIDANNVASALARVRPYGIDLCSGVEASMGKKDPEKVRRLVEAFRAAVRSIEEGEA
jgi:phosphoribosylanthranilate isomerase